VKLKTAGELSEILQTVLFCPEDLALIKAGAAERRTFLDRAICEAQNQLYSGFSPEELATLDRLQKKMLRNLSALTQNHSKEVSKS